MTASGFLTVAPVIEDSMASEVAAAVGISKSAFLERLRRGQAALFEQLFS